MVERVYANLSSEFVDNQDTHGQIENILKFMSQIWHQEISYQR